MWPQQQFGFPQYQAPQQTGQQGNIAWVVGRAGADAHYTLPGATDVLMDSTGDVFYVKSADATGRATVETYDYKRRSEDESGYATMADLAAMEKRIMEAFDGRKPLQQGDGEPAHKPAHAAPGGDSADGRQ